MDKSDDECRHMGTVSSHVSEKSDETRESSIPQHLPHSPSNSAQKNFKPTIVQLKKPIGDRKQLPKSTGGRPPKRFPKTPKGNLTPTLHAAIAAQRDAKKKRREELQILRKQGIYVKRPYNRQWEETKKREPSGRRINSQFSQILKNQHDQMQMSQGMINLVIDDAVFTHLPIDNENEEAKIKSIVKQRKVSTTSQSSAPNSSKLVQNPNLLPQIINYNPNTKSEIPFPQATVNDEDGHFDEIQEFEAPLSEQGPASTINFPANFPDQNDKICKKYNCGNSKSIGIQTPFNDGIAHSLFTTLDHVATHISIGICDIEDTSLFVESSQADSKIPQIKKLPKVEAFNQMVFSQAVNAFVKGALAAKIKANYDVVEDTLEYFDNSESVIKTEKRNRYVQREAPRLLEMGQFVKEALDKMNGILKNESFQKMQSNLNYDIENPHKPLLPTTYNNAKITEQQVKAGNVDAIFCKIGDVCLTGRQLLSIANEEWYDDNIMDSLINDMMTISGERKMIPITTFRARLIMELKFKHRTQESNDAFLNYIQSNGPSAIGMLIPMMHANHWRLLQVNLVTGGLHIFDPFGKLRTLPQKAIDDIQRLLTFLSLAFPDVPGFKLPTKKWVAKLKDNFLLLPDIYLQTDGRNCGPIVIEALRLLSGNRDVDRESWPGMPQRIKSATLIGDWNSIRGLHISIMASYAPRSWNLLTLGQLREIEEKGTLKEDPEKIQLPENPKFCTTDKSEDSDAISILKVVQDPKINSKNRKPVRKRKRASRNIAAKDLNSLFAKYGAAINQSDTLISESEAQRKWQIAKNKREGGE